jgi:hypothetical protein
MAAGWRRPLVRLLPDVASVTLVESKDVGIVGVGEATLPHIRALSNGWDRRGGLYGGYPCHLQAGH